MSRKDITLKYYEWALNEARTIEPESTRKSLEKRLHRERRIVETLLKRGFIPRRPALASLCKALVKREIPGAPNQLLYIRGIFVALAEGHINGQYRNSLKRQSTLAAAVIAGEIPYSAAPTEEDRRLFIKRGTQEILKELDEELDETSDDKPH